MTTRVRVPFIDLVRDRAFLAMAGAIFVVAVLTGLVGGTILGRIVIVLFINLIIVLGLQIFTGNSGLLSFAHIGFMGIGAYVSAILTMTPAAKGFAIPNLYPFLVDVQVPFIVALLIGALVGGLVAAVISFPIMRLSDVASVISTFALLVIVHVVLAHWSELTNGPRTVFGLSPETDLPTATVWALVFLAIAWWFKHSALGLKLRASRDSEHAAATIGVDIVRVRWIAFTISAFVCAFAGGLWAHFITSFAPSAFYLQQTFVVLTMLIVGGPRTVSGAVIGTFVVTFAFEALRAIENQINLDKLLPFQLVGLTGISLAIALIVVLAVRPGGLVEERELLSGSGAPGGDPSGDGGTTPTADRPAAEAAGEVGT